MNLFVIGNQKESAQALDDRRLVKMTVETLQLFAYAMNNLEIPDSFYPISKETGLPYKSKNSHTKHPVTLWLQKSVGNFDWMFIYLQEMMAEYEHRFNKPSFVDPINLERIQSARNLWPIGELTPFANCSLHQNIEDTLVAYKKTLVDKWKKGELSTKTIPRWTRRERPNFELTSC